MMAELPRTEFLREKSAERAKQHHNFRGIAGSENPAAHTIG
jgi:hypothetical protein